MIGNRVLWEATLGVHDQLGVLRPRWLALATRINGPTVSMPLSPWLLPSHTIDHAKSTLPWTLGVASLVLNEEAWTFATDKQYLPRKMIKNLPSLGAILASRSYSDRDTLPTVMACLGQHELPPSHLAKFGYMAHFKHVSDEWP